MASLHQAVEDCNVKKVEELLSSGVYQVNCTDGWEGRTPLHTACGKSYFDLVRVLVRYGADFTARDKHNDTPLTLAAGNFKYDCVLWIIKEFDCNVNTRGASGKTLLHYACADGNIDLVHVLVQDYKADLNIKNMCGDRPIVTAAKSGKYDVVKSLLCDYGCNCNVRSEENGNTLLHFACADGNTDFMHVLIKDFQADLNIRNKYEQTPLMIAANRNNFGVWFSLVYDYGCDPNVKNNDGHTLLHIACAVLNIDLVHVLVKNCKADLNIEDNCGKTPLMIAAKENQYEVVRTLVCDYGCIPNVENNIGDTPLHFACARENFDLVHFIVKCKPHLNIENIFGETPLVILAASKNHYEAVKSLVCDYGCDPNVKNKKGYTPLHIACANNDIDLVHVLVKECKADLNEGCYYDQTPLTILAAKENHYEMVKSLVCDYGCDPNVQNNHGDTLLHIACANGYIDLVHVLIRDCKADLNIKNYRDETPIVLAAESCHYEIVRSLVCDYGCDPNVKNNAGSTLLHIACSNGNIDLVHVLVQECKANLNIKAHDCETPLIRAAKRKHHELVKSLVCDYGCDPNVKDYFGHTLLHFACIVRNIDLVHLLVKDCNADLNIKDNNGETPLMIAARRNQFEVVKLLVCDYGCILNVENHIGDTPLHFACAREKFDLVHSIVKCKPHLIIENIFGEIPLVMIAASKNHYEVVMSLVCDYGCDPNVKNKEDDTPLHIACANGDIDLVHVLVKDCKADLNIKDSNGKTPLMIAVNRNHYDVWKSLVCDYGCNPNTKNNIGDTLLHIACANGGIDTVHVLVRDCKAEVNIKNYKGETPLMIATNKTHNEVVKALVCDYGCDPNHEILLHTACYTGNIDLVHVLLRDCKADLHYHYNDNTPLMTAVRCNKCEIVKALISEYNCDVNITDSNGRSLLHMAGGVEVLNLLLVEYRMSPLLADNDGNTPLHMFASTLSPTLSCVQVVSTLLFEYKAPMYIFNKEGKSPKALVRADKIGSVFTKYLTEHGEEIQVDYKSMQLLAAKRYSGSNLICRLFVVGHPGAGKSSLVETLKREGFLDSFSRISEKLVPPHTAGIVPSIYLSDNGRIQFYDFAGDPEYYSSHAAILERLFQSNIGTNICIIVLNLLEDDAEIKEKYLFWLSFINYSFKRLKESPSVLVIGSHSDQLPNKKEVSRKKSYIQDLLSKYKKECVYLSLDCRNRRSSNIKLLRQSINEISKKSQPYSLSPEEGILLGLLEKDFSNVTACTAQTVASHIKEINLCLSSSISFLYPILQQLQAIGVLLLVGGKEQDCYIVLNVAQLTNEVHKKLFSQDAFYINPSLASFKIGLLPQSLLQEVLPKYITKECLIQLQYCQEVAHIEIGSDHSVSPSLVGPDISTSPDKSYLFFPALCCLDKKDISWQTPPEHSYSIGWLARCRDPHDYFPPRFLHVLLLRIALRFTLIAYDKASPDHQQLKRQCEMWKTGMHWSSEEGVECEVDVIGSKKVAVSLKSAEESKMCLSVFNSIISCVMEAKAEFCDFIVLDSFLLDKVSCLTDDNLFPVEDVERVLREGKANALSLNGKKFLSSSKLVHISSSFWSHLFPIDEHSVLKYIETIVREWLQLGLNLDLLFSDLKAIETKYPRDMKRCKTEMVITWLNSSLPHPPCWWSLAKALRETEKTAWADKITKDKGEHVALQEKLFNSQDSHLTPDEDFLESFAEVVGSKWPYLASLLSLTSSTVEEVRREGESLTQRERALLMLHKWVSKEEATYSQLYQKLKPVSLFQYCK